MNPPIADLSPQQRQLRILAIVLVVVGLVFWLQFLIIPQTGSAARLGSELTGLRLKVERARQEVRRLPDMEKKLDDLAARYSMSTVSTPPAEQLPDLLDKIAQFARGARVRVVTLRPKEDLGAVQAGPSGYLEIPLELVATAGYHQIGRFLNQLERSDSLVRLRELEIRPGKEMLGQEVKMMLLAFLAPGQETSQDPESLRGTK